MAPHIRAEPATAVRHELNGGVFMIKPDMEVFQDMLNGIDKWYSIDTGGQVSE